MGKTETVFGNMYKVISRYMKAGISFDERPTFALHCFLVFGLCFPGIGAGFSVETHGSVFSPNEDAKRIRFFYFLFNILFKHGVTGFRTGEQIFIPGRRFTGTLFLLQ